MKIRQLAEGLYSVTDYRGTMTVRDDTVVDLIDSNGVLHLPANTPDDECNVSQAIYDLDPITGLPIMVRFDIDQSERRSRQMFKNNFEEVGDSGTYVFTAQGEFQCDYDNWESKLMNTGAWEKYVVVSDDNKKTEVIVFDELARQLPPDFKYKDMFQHLFYRETFDGVLRIGLFDEFNISVSIDNDEGFDVDEFLKVLFEQSPFNRHMRDEIKRVIQEAMVV